jgi:hypothetical protein
MSNEIGHRNADFIYSGLQDYGRKILSSNPPLPLLHDLSDEGEPNLKEEPVPIN